MNTIQLENRSFVNNTSEIEISLDHIQVDYSIIPRDGVDEKQVAILEDLIKLKDRQGENPELDPMHIFQVGEEVFLSRGLHRYHAYKKFADNVDSNLLVPVTIFTGSKEDLIAHACTAGKGEKPIKGYSRKEKRMMVQNYLQLPYNRPPLKSWNKLAEELGVVTDKTIKEIWETAVEQPDGTLKFEEKSNVLSFPKQKREPAKGFQENEEIENDFQGSEFRGRDYYEEDHSSEQPERSPSLPDAPTKINDVRPERERLQQQIEQLQQELAQANKELGLLAVVRQERDEYQASIERMQSASSELLEQNADLSIQISEMSQEILKLNARINELGEGQPQSSDYHSEEIDRLNSQIQSLTAENEILKQQSQPTPETEEKLPPVTGQVIKEIAKMGVILARRNGCTSVETAIENLIENNFSPELIQSVLTVSETERVKQLESELAIAIQSKLEIQQTLKELEDSQFLKDQDTQTIKRLESELKVKTDLIQKIKETDDKKLELANLATEIKDMGGWQKVKESATQTAALKAKVEKFTWIQTTMGAIAEAVNWTKEEKEGLIAGDSTNAMEKLKSALTQPPELPRDPNKQIDIILETSGFAKMMEKIFSGMDFLDSLLVNVPGDRVVPVIGLTTLGLIAEGNIPISWKGLFRGAYKLSYQQF